jgi:GntR family transcriptional repressor for pyruvate dehydrogenase complex
MQTETAQIIESELTAHVVNHIRAKIEGGDLKPGDKIPPEREFAKMLNISRASLRTGIGYLTAMGVMKVRRRVGTFVAEGPAEIGKTSLNLLGALHGFDSGQLNEARKLMESNLAALAAERGKKEQLMVIAEELAEMYATIDDPALYLLHDVCFHRAIAHAACNPVLAALMGTISTTFYDERRKAAGTGPDRKKSMEEHQAIYRAIRNKKPAEARAAMERHLISSESDQYSILSVPKASYEQMRNADQHYA